MRACMQQQGDVLAHAPSAGMLSARVARLATTSPMSAGGESASASRLGLAGRCQTPPTQSSSSGSWPEGGSSGSSMPPGAMGAMPLVDQRATPMREFGREALYCIVLAFDCMMGAPGPTPCSQRNASDDGLADSFLLLPAAIVGVESCGRAGGQQHRDGSQALGWGRHRSAPAALAARSDGLPCIRVRNSPPSPSHPHNTIGGC